ncbi:coiled-coil domain-containing protein 71 isoform X1 [Rana temporaria]|uniref:coiled-coil domain-containing protein 71 isoform X1 n=2 Tax=Rana temporaria TaxID=8407 RepID=UPI001AAD4797|nr:coiled-coil domain-containing protein 71 isoform X1 [Rana temporaria]
MAKGGLTVSQGSTKLSRQTLPPNAMNDHMEKKAVHSWSRFSSAGKSALEEALRVFNPMSKDLTDTETQLVTFLQGLREEGYQPTVLSSKDVYGYNSTTANTPPLKTKGPSKTTPAVSSSKTQTKNQNGRVSNSPVDISVKATKISSRPSARKSANLLLSSLKKTDLKKSKVSPVDFPSNMYPGVYPAMRLSVVLEAIVPIKSAASSIEASLRPRPASKASSKGKNNQAYQCLLKQTSPPNGTVLNGANGRILKENNACNTLGVLNGRILVSSPSRFNGMTHTKQNTKLQVDVIFKDEKCQQAGKDKKRKQAEAFQEPLPNKKIKIFIPLAKKPTLDKDKYNLLKSKVIKVDKASSDEDVRRKAQQMLKVNLSPVLRIQPLLLNIQ